MTKNCDLRDSNNPDCRVFYNREAALSAIKNIVEKPSLEIFRNNYTCLDGILYEELEEFKII